VKRSAAILSAAILAVIVAAPSAALAERAKRPWPPIPERGVSFVHYGEEHWNDLDGLRILPRVVAQAADYRPDAVLMSADKDDDGTVESLTRWKELMRPYNRRGIPYFAAVGNHDRKARPGFPHGVDPMGDLTNHMNLFASRPYPFGDAPPYRDRLLQPRRRPASDPPGASSHYAVETGPVRWIFIDNSCYGIVTCDPLQNPMFPDAAGNQGQYDFLAREAEKATKEGDLAFVVMHMPTRDDRPGHTQPTPGPHTMGEGTSPDNVLFEQNAEAAGIDAVFAGHIKGMWQYEARGIPYFTDGGAGGEVYVGPGEETGVDSGYWHGYRLIRVRGGKLRTDAVPVFRRDGIEIDGPHRVEVGEVARFLATGQQPTKEGPDVNLELRAPDPSRPNADTLPEPAHIWATMNRRVLRPVATEGDDPRRNPRRQTTTGAFVGRCPGLARVKAKSGWEFERFTVRVTGPKSSRCR